MAARLGKWESRLAQFVESNRATPFKWGHHDCATFACKCIEVITGEYPIEERWASKGKAMRLIQERSLTDRASDHFPQIDVNLAQRGDLVATMTDDGIALGIFFFAGRSVRIQRWSVVSPEKRVIESVEGLKCHK